MPTSNFIVEKSSFSRLTEIFALLDKYIYPIYQDDYERWKGKLEGDFSSGKKISIVATIDDRIVGLAIFQAYNISFPNIKTIEIKTMIVVEDYRNSKFQVGTALLDKLHYEAQRTGYNRLVVDAKFDNPIVPWFIGKGYKITNFNREYKWLSYKLEYRVPEVFTDDVDDPELVIKWVMKKLSIINARPIIEGSIPAYEGSLKIGIDPYTIEINSKVKYCYNEEILAELSKVGLKDNNIVFYIINFPKDQLKADVYSKVIENNNVLIDCDKLNKILSIEYPILNKFCSGDSYCIAVLIYPEIFRKMIEKFGKTRCKIVITGKMGNLLFEDSRIIFVSNLDYTVLGAANYLGVEHVEGKNEAWQKCKNDTVFEENEFMRWANIKKYFTIFDIKDLLYLKERTLLKINDNELIMNKWCYYPYKIFMDHIYKQLLE